MDDTNNPMGGDTNQPTPAPTEPTEPTTPAEPATPPATEPTTPAGDEHPQG